MPSVLKAFGDYLKINRSRVLRRVFWLWLWGTALTLSEWVARRLTADDSPAIQGYEQVAAFVLLVFLAWFVIAVAAAALFSLLEAYLVARSAAGVFGVPLAGMFDLERYDAIKHLIYKVPLLRLGWTRPRQTYRIVLACNGVPQNMAGEAAKSIEQDFRNFRTHYQNVSCEFRDGELWLNAESDFDPDGLALSDEFSDLICAYLPPFDGDIRVVSSDGQGWAVQRRQN